MSDTPQNSENRAAVLSRGMTIAAMILVVLLGAGSALAPSPMESTWPWGISLLLCTAMTTLALLRKPLANAAFSLSVIVTLSAALIHPAAPLVMVLLGGVIAAAAVTLIGETPIQRALRFAVLPSLVAYGVFVVTWAALYAIDRQAFSSISVALLGDNGWGFVLALPASLVAYLLWRPYTAAPRTSLSWLWAVAPALLLIPVVGLWETAPLNVALAGAGLLVLMLALEGELSPAPSVPVTAAAVPAPPTTSALPLPPRPAPNTLDAILRTLADDLQRRFNVDTLFIVLNPDNRDDMLTYPLVQVDGRPLPPQVYPLLPGSIEAEAMRSTGPVNQIVNDQTFSLRTLKADDYRAFVGVPMRHADAAIGMVGLFHAEVPFSEAEAAELQAMVDDRALAIDKARFEAHTNALTEKLPLVNETLRTVLLNLNPDEAMVMICEAAMQITGADRAALYLMSENQQTFELAHDINLMPAYRERSQQFQREPHQQRRIISHILPDQVPERLYELSRLGDFKAIAQTTITSGSALGGMLTVYHIEPHRFTEMELNLLDLLASQIMVALDNAKLVNTLEQYAGDMAQLIHLSRSSLQSLQAAEIAAQSIDTFQSAFQIDAAIMLTFITAQNGQDYVMLLGKHPAGLNIPEEQSLNIYPELRALRMGTQTYDRTVDVSDRDLSNGMRSLLKNHGLQSALIVPMKVNQKVFGVIILANNAPRTFTNREMQFIETAANLTAAQLRNAQQYNATREALVQRLEQLSFIETLVQQISDTYNIADIIDSVLDATRRITQADTVTLLEITPSGQYRLIRQQLHGDDGGRSDEIVAEIGGALADVMQTRETLLSPAYGLPEDTGETPPLNQYPSVLAVPLIHRGEIMGVLSVESRRRNFFVDEQARFLQNLAGHTAISIANARHLSDRQHQVEVLSHLRQLSLDVTGVNDRRRVMGHIASTTTRLFDCQQVAAYHYDATRRKLRETINPQTGAMNETEGTAMFPPISLEVAESVISHNQPRVLYDEADDGPTTRTLLLIPLVRGRHIRELLVLMFDGRLSITQHHRETIEMLISTASSHLENAVLYEQVQAVNRRVRTILESTQDGMILLTRDARLVEFNTAAGAMLDVDLSGYVGRSFNEVPMRFNPVEQPMRSASIANLPRGARLIELVYEPDPDDDEAIDDELTTLYVDQLVLPVYAEDNQTVTGILLVLRDVTVDKKLADYRDEVIAMLVHDLRSPLGNVISAMDYAINLAEDPEAAPMIPSILDLAMSSANRLMRLINTLLDLERQHMTILPDDVKLADVAEAAKNEAIHLAQQFGIEIAIKMPESLPILRVDQEKIERVLINLIDNAMRFAESEVRVISAYDSKRQRVLVRVSDDGPGIPEENKDVIFAKFAQGPVSSRRGKTKNTGIGLAYCRRAVEAHGGSIWVENGCDLPGACFTFTLPVTNMPQAQSTSTMHDVTE